MPVRIQCCQARGSLCVNFTPVWTALIALKYLLDVVEVRAIRHALIHMHRDVGRIALVGRAEPDIVLMHEAALYRKMNGELLLFDSILNLAYHARKMFRGNVILHLLETHHARRGKEAMTVINLVNRSNAHGRDIADRLCQPWQQAATF